MWRAYRARTIGGVVLLLGLQGLTEAQIPSQVAFQGYLTETTGAPLEGPVTLTLRLFDAATGGTKLWEETQTVTVSTGLFSTLLGSASPLTLAFDRPYWVELQVGAEVLSPRQPLASSPYAWRAKTVENLSTGQNGHVGIGTTGPAGTLDVRGGTASSGAGVPIILSAQQGAVSSNGGNVILNAGPNGAGALNGYIAFGTGSSFTGNELTTERMRITTSGNVGIGTTSPTAILTVRKDADGSATLGRFVNLTGGAASTNETVELIFGLSDGTSDFGGSALVVGKESDYTTAANRDSFLAFETMLNDSRAERVRITSSGHVGIGTTSPSQKLEVNGAVRLAPTGAPATPVEGTLYFEATSKHFFGFDGTTWKQLDN